MTSLKSNLLFFSILASGCSTSYYKATQLTDLRVELSVSSDRVITDCGRIMPDSDEFMFLVNVLDDQNTVLGMMEIGRHNEEDCRNSKKSVDKVLKNGKKMIIGATGVVTEPRVTEDYGHNFPGHGFFYNNGRSLQIVVINNEIGDCYGVHLEDNDHCPEDAFPIGTHH